MGAFETFACSILVFLWDVWVPGDHTDQGGSKESPCLANFPKPQYGLNIISNVWSNSNSE